MNILQRSMRADPIPKAMLGVSLIEMMISLTIGLIIIAGIGYAFLGSRQNFRSQDVLARMQEGARTAFEIMDRDIRMAGFTGCPTNNNDINILAAAADWDKNLITQNTPLALVGQPLMGYEQGSAFPAGVNGVLRGDGLTVLHADNSREFIVSSQATPASAITLTANHNLRQGEILVVAKPDCSRIGVFQKTNVCTVDAATGNCNDAVVQPGINSTTASDIGGDTFGAGSRIYRLSAATYYIGTGSSGDPSLFRRVPGDPTNPTQELIEGVQDMQLSYGIDTSATPDGAVDSYVTANAVPDWTKVLGIRVSLLMVSRQSEQGITTKAQQYKLDMNGDGMIDASETFTPNDLLLRKVFTTTIAVKNRL